MIWNGPFLPFWWCFCINSWQSPALCPDIVFGFALMNHLIRCYNLRITYPFLDIYLWDDDDAGTYREPKYSPTVYKLQVLESVYHEGSR